MKKVCSISFLLILVCSLPGYAQQKEITTYYENLFTGRSMERLNVYQVKSDTIKNDSVCLTCKVSDWREIEYKRENLKTGAIIEIEGNTAKGFTKYEKNKNNRYIIEKEFSAKTGKLKFYMKYYLNKDKKAKRIPVGVAYNFDNAGDISDSSYYEKDYKFSDDILIALETDSQFCKTYDLSRQGLTLKQKVALRKETFDIRQFRTDTIISDSVRETCLVRDRRTIIYIKENKKSTQTISITGNTVDGFKKNIRYGEKYYTKIDESKYFDINGNLREYQKYDTLHFFDLVYFCQYDADGKLIKGSYCEKNHFRFNYDKVEKYINRKLMCDIKKAIHITPLVMHPDSVMMKYKIWVFRYTKDEKGVWFIYCKKMLYKDKLEHVFTIELDGNTGALFNVKERDPNEAIYVGNEHVIVQKELYQ